MGAELRETTACGALKGWCAELLEDMPAATRPRPFDCVEHRLPSLEAATAWLGGAPISEALEEA